MLSPCIPRTNGLYQAAPSGNPTPARYAPGGIPLDSSNKLVIATNAPAGTDFYNNGFRYSANGAIRGSVSGGSGSVFRGGFWFTTDGRLRISDGVSAVANFQNGDPFVSSGRLGLSY